MSEEQQNNNQEEKQPETLSETFTQSPTPPEVVEVPWEEVEDTLRLRRMYSENEEAFAKFLVDVERRKLMLTARLSKIEEAIYENARTLRESKELNPDWTYELKLPESSGEKGYFIRKEE